MKSEIKLTLASLEKDSFHLLVNGSVNGEVLTMVIDTGASRSCFDIDFLSNIINQEHFEENESPSSGIGTNEMFSKITCINNLLIGEFEINNYTAVGIDMKHIHQAYQTIGLPTVNGIIGSDILLKYKAIIDYRKCTLILKRYSK